MQGRLFDGRISRGTVVTVSVLGDGLRLESEDGNLVFWTWHELPRHGLTTTGAKTIVTRGAATLEVEGRAFLDVVRRAHPRAAFFRSPFRLWIATPWRFAVTTLAAIGVLTFLFLVLVPAAGDAIAASLPPELERAAGLSLREQAIAGQTVLPAASLRLQTFWNDLHLPTEPMHITVVDDGATVNAFALMGGQILVYKGLIEKAQSADELAGVLAHEAGHGTLHHSARMIGRSLAGAFLLGFLLNDPSGITGAVLGNAESLRTLQFSREMEAQADAWAAQALNGKADVHALGRLLQRIEQFHLPGWTTFLTSHPATDDRVQAWSNAEGTPASQPLQDDFAALKASIP